MIFNLKLKICLHVSAWGNLAYFQLLEELSADTGQIVGVNHQLIDKLQSLQNASACLVTAT